MCVRITLQYMIKLSSTSWLRSNCFWKLSSGFRSRIVDMILKSCNHIIRMSYYFSMKWTLQQLSFHIPQFYFFPYIILFYISLHNFIILNFLHFFRFSFALPFSICYINYFTIFRSGESNIQIFPLPLPILMKVSSISLACVFTHLYSTSGGFASAQHLNLSSEPSTMRSIFERDTFGA